MALIDMRSVVVNTSYAPKRSQGAVDCRSSRLGNLCDVLPGRIGCHYVLIRFQMTWAGAVAGGCPVIEQQPGLMPIAV